jgi:hypothetical protein
LGNCHARARLDAQTLLDADWTRNHAVKLAELLQLKRTWMPHHNTIRRVFQTICA